jgi:Flp pilus assembly protein CpaB
LITFAVVLAFLSGISRTTEVVIASRGLAAGTRLTSEDVMLKRIHASAGLHDALRDPAGAIGQVLSAPRLPGEQIPRSLVGDRAISGIAATLPPDWRAIAIRVDQATGLAGILRAGDWVEAVAVLDSETLGYAVSEDNPGTLSRIVLHDLQVLLVPQSFRYEEAPVDASGSLALAPVRTTTSAQASSVIVLGAPVTPTVIALLPVDPPKVKTLGATEPVTPTLLASPVELLALLNAKGTIHLVLQPVERAIIPTEGIAWNDLLRDLVLPTEDRP